MAFRELDREVLRSLWLMASATWGLIWLKVTVIGRGSRVPFELHPGICLKLRRIAGCVGSVKDRVYGFA
jgi:hypothetical protein